MFEPQEIRSEHKDVIHDVLYDYYGQRIATCSSDQTVKVNKKMRTASKKTNIALQYCIYFFRKQIEFRSIQIFLRADLGSK